MAIIALGMAGIAGGQSLLNQGLGMLNQDRQAEKNKEQAKYQQGLDKEMYLIFGTYQQSLVHQSIMPHIMIPF